MEARRRAVLIARPAALSLNSAVFDPSGKHIITSSDDATAIWDAASLDVLVGLPGGSGGITMSSFSSDGLMAITKEDEKSRVWWIGSAGQVMLTAPRGSNIDIDTSCFGDRPSVATK